MTSKDGGQHGAQKGEEKCFPFSTRPRQAGGRNEDYFNASPSSENGGGSERMKEYERMRHNPVFRYKNRARSGQTEEEQKPVSSRAPALSEYERKIPNNRKHISTQDSGLDELCPCCGKPKSDAEVNEECEEESRQVETSNMIESSGDAKDANISCQSTGKHQDPPETCEPADVCNQTENCSQVQVEQPRKRSGQCYQCYNCNCLQACSCPQKPVCPETCLVIPSPKRPKLCSPCPRPCPRPSPCPRPCASPLCQVLCSTCGNSCSTNQECTDGQWRQRQRIICQRKPTCGCSVVCKPKCRAPTC